jgi:hypothetical protein
MKKGSMFGYCVIYAAVFQSELLYASSGGARKIEVVFRTVTVPTYIVAVWKKTIENTIWIATVMKLLGLALCTFFGRTIWTVA